MRGDDGRRAFARQVRRKSLVLVVTQIQIATVPAAFSHDEMMAAQDLAWLLGGSFGWAWRDEEG